MRSAAGSGVKPWEIILNEDETERPSRPTRLTALDVRGEHRVLANLTDDDLASLQLLDEGMPLQRFRHYLDLHDPARADFVAEGTERVKPGQRLIARDGTDPELFDAVRRACGYVVGRRAG